MGSTLYLNVGAPASRAKLIDAWKAAVQVNDELHERYKKTGVMEDGRRGMKDD